MITNRNYLGAHVILGLVFFGGGIALVTQEVEHAMAIVLALVFGYCSGMVSAMLTLEFVRAQRKNNISEK